LNYTSWRSPNCIFRNWNCKTKIKRSSLATMHYHHPTNFTISPTTTIKHSTYHQPHDNATTIINLEFTILWDAYLKTKVQNGIHYCLVSFQLFNWHIINIRIHIISHSSSLAVFYKNSYHFKDCLLLIIIL